MVDQGVTTDQRTFEFPLDFSAYIFELSGGNTVNGNLAVTAETDDNLSADTATVNVYAQFRAPYAIKNIIMCHQAWSLDQRAILIMVRKGLCSLTVSNTFRTRIDPLLTLTTS
jgi:hypothetical protein